MVIIDTSIWVPALRDKNSREQATVSRLVRSGGAATVGVVLLEVLRGARTSADFEELNYQLHAAEFIDVSEASWIKAAGLMLELKLRGETIPLPDAIIAGQALEGDHQVWTSDEHFKRVPGLRLYRP